MISGSYIMKSGKYKGLPLSSIVKFNAGYIMFLYDKFEWFNLESEFKKEVFTAYRQHEKFVMNQQNAWAHGFGKQAKSVRDSYNSELFSIEYDEREKYNVLEDM